MEKQKQNVLFIYIYIHIDMYRDTYVCVCERYCRVMITFIIMSNNNTHTHVTHTDFVVATRRTEDRAQGH